MIISLNWLKEYVDLEGISPEEIEEKLTTSGLEVDEMIDKGKAFNNFVVGYVKEKKKHPNADRLSLCTVSDGEKDYNVVCGAPNVEGGQKIVFAKVGAVIPEGGFEIKKAKLRGEVSEGMICSEKELGLGDDHDGIMVLDENLEEGTPIADVFGLNDVQYDIAVTPNRQDALSHIGVARDLAALLNKELKKPEIDIKEGEEDANELASFEIQNSDDCPRYSGRVVTGIKIKESPEWLKQRLISVGSRPINNVVDVTNFILHELGQPLHAFDLDTVAHSKIIVRSAGEKQKFITLDSKERQLEPTDLMICDGTKPVAIGGVMGGENSEVTDDTVNVLIESAYFRPGTVRATAKRLGMSTDASYRFERGTDPDGTVYAANRAAQLIAELGGGTVAKGAIDAYPNKVEPREVKLRYGRIERILGYKVPDEEVKRILNKLELKVLEENDDTLLVNVPPFRHDIEREIDLIEEVARIYGYDKIPEIDHLSVTLEEKVDQSEKADEYRNILVGLGFSEIVTNSLLNEKIAGTFGTPVKLLNPQSAEMSHLRPSLLPGMLGTISRNIKVNERDLRLFETGHVFELKEDGKAIGSFDDFNERETLVLALTGSAVNDEWHSENRKYDIYDLKGVVGEFLSKNYLDKMLNYSYYQKNSTYFDYGFNVIVNDLSVALCGKVSGKFADLYDIEQDVFAAVINITELKRLRAEEKTYTEVLKYPKVIRDSAFVLDRTVDADSVIEVIKEGASNLLKNVKLFDIFESDNLGKGKKSLAFQLEYYDVKRTLTEDEVEKDFWNSINLVKKKLNAELRG